MLVNMTRVFCNPAIGNPEWLQPLGRLPKNWTPSIILEPFIHMFLKTRKFYYIYIILLHQCGYINIYISIYLSKLFFPNCPCVNSPTVVLHGEPINFSRMGIGTTSWNLNPVETIHRGLNGLNKHIFKIKTTWNIAKLLMVQDSLLTTTWGW